MSSEYRQNIDKINQVNYTFVRVHTLESDSLTVTISRAVFKVSIDQIAQRSDSTIDLYLELNTSFLLLFDDIMAVLTSKSLFGHYQYKHDQYAQRCALWSIDTTLVVRENKSVPL